MNEPFDKSKYQGKWEINWPNETPLKYSLESYSMSSIPDLDIPGVFNKLSDNPMRFAVDDNGSIHRVYPDGYSISPSQHSEPNPDYITPPDGSVTGGGFINGEEFVEIMRDGKPVKYFRRES